MKVKKEILEFRKVKESAVIMVMFLHIKHKKVYEEVKPLLRRLILLHFTKDGKIDKNVLYTSVQFLSLFSSSLLD